MTNPTIDFFPFGQGKLLIQLFSQSTIPEHIGFGRYYHGACEIRLVDGSTDVLECIIYRPNNHRNVMGNRITDWLWLWVKAEFTGAQLSSASVTRYGAELSEQEIDVGKQELALWRKSRHA